jgi:hypothetical protein
MGTINDNRGCSVCEAGKENYTTFSTRLGRKQVKRVQYDYRTPEGDLFACVGQSLDDCRRKRDEWLANQ